MNKKISRLIIVILIVLNAAACSNSVKPIASEDSSQYPASTEQSIPDNLRVPEGNALLLQTSATGVQIYVCQASEENPNQFEWALKAPEADLIAFNGEQIGTHYQGPTWEHNDDSKVIGEVLERADSPDSNAIPWLLLSAKFNEGNGVFSQVTYIHRLNTSGGQAPAEGCDRSTVDAEIRVDYTADYYFYTTQ